MSFAGTQLEYAAAAHILTAPILRNRTEPLLDPGRQSIDFDALLLHSETWSRGEKLLVKAALDMWNGCGEATLGELISTLDSENLNRVLHAVAMRREHF